MDDLDKDTKLRLTALDRAIDANTGNIYSDNNLVIVSPDIILEAAKKFEAYLKGDNNG